MYLHDQVPENHHYANLKATPVIPTSPELWMLGSSGESAMIAAKQGASLHSHSSLTDTAALK